VKKTASEGQIDPMSLARAVNQTLELYPQARVALPRLMKRASEMIHGTQFVPNWFLPVEVGGMGIDPKFGPRRRHKIPGWYENLPSKISREQRMVAARFLAEPNLRLTFHPSTLKFTDGYDRFCKLFARVTPLRAGDCSVPQAHVFEEKDYRDEWAERYMVFRKMLFDGVVRQPPDTRFRKIRVMHRLHPVSYSRLEEAWGIRFWAAQSAVPPPLLDLPSL
jgi:hypothetical protein